jgi:hypothetical protein
VRGQQARPDVGHHRHVQVGQLGDGNRAGEAGDDEVRRVHLEDHCGVLADGCGVVLAPDAVGGAHLAQAGPGRGEQLGDPEAVADLDEFAAGDDDLPPSPREGRRHQRERRGTVVGQVCGAGAGDGGQQRLDRCPPTGPAVAGGEVELHVAGSGG